MDSKAFLLEVENLMTGFWLTDLANFSALVFLRLPGINWAGFYLFDGQVLRLGPFAGKPACTEIARGRGVCGAAYSRNEILIVGDVHDFPGHIACDPESRSELVIPFGKGGEIGVLDVDAPSVGRFSQTEAAVLRQGLEILSRKNQDFAGLPLFTRPSQ